METLLRTTTCSKGHTHPPWNTIGVLRIEKCESICGFCQKETKTAANLRKHVAIHIKNERLNLIIAEGSSGRGRLEMPHAFDRESTSSSRLSQISDDVGSDAVMLRESSGSSRQRSSHSSTTSSFSPSAVLMSMHQPHSHAGIARTSYQGNTVPTLQGSQAQASSLSYPYTYPTAGPVAASYGAHEQSYVHQVPTQHSYSDRDLFRGLREHNISTKTAWTVIPSSEGTRVLDLCKSLSVVQDNSSPTQGSGRSGQLTLPRVPCYHRETLYDEEWQAHMRDVHGVFFLWPETWMRRIEVVDLEPYGGDIGGINNLMMAG
ncbi:hypothetical protein BJ875DRAFT_439248 [Amylocarpus encephaloides]|uniref:Uncharacterized protein n=1 Tax=Amylocarpus encephaloides TaxID=45428 RepID=A0A9P7YN72_9HELO|nr:hypothetical protein BJ875DRAFT_439248 [Amylocarpus encephaloides]